MVRGSEWTENGPRRRWWYNAPLSSIQLCLVPGQPSGSQVNSVSSAASSDIATFQGSSSMSSSVSSVPASTGHRSSAASTQGTSQQQTASQPAASIASTAGGTGSMAPTSQGAQSSAPQHQQQHQKPKAADAHNSKFVDRASFTWLPESHCYCCRVQQCDRLAQ